MKRKGRLALALLLVAAACSESTSSGDSPKKSVSDVKSRLLSTMHARAQAGALDIVQGGNNFYSVFVNNSSLGEGQYTVMTGPNHPVTISTGSPKNVLFGDGEPGTTFNTVHSYTSGISYAAAPGSSPAPVSSMGDSVVFLNSATPGITTSTIALGTTGYQTTYTLSGTGATRDKMTIVQVVQTHGTTFETSTVEVTTTITNNDSHALQVGLRYEWDTQIGADDGPTFQARSPDGPVLVAETNFAPPAFDFYKIEDNGGNATTPLFSVFGTVSSALTTITPTPTTPDRIVDASWPGADVTAFFYSITPGRDVSSPSGDVDDNAVLYYWGATQATAIPLATGASRTFSESLVSAEADAPPPFNQPPVAKINSPANNSSFAEGTNISFAGTGTDPEDGTLSGASLVWTDGATQIGTGTSFSYGALAQGTHTLTLTVTDSKGATGTASVTVTITGEATNQNPTAAITSPNVQQSFVQGATIAFAGTGHDPEDGTLTGASLVWTLDGTTTVIGTGTSFSLSNIAVGGHSVTLTVTDSKGAHGSATRAFMVTAPAQNQLPTAHITAPTGGAVFTTGSAISFAGTGTDPEDGALTGASLVWTDGATQIGTGTSFNVSTLAAGTHTITLTVTDSKGAKGTATVSIIVGFTQSVGSAGGTLCVEACHLSLFIPQGALSSTVSFYEYPIAIPPLAPGGIVGAAHFIGPNVTFSTNAALGIGYDPTTLPAGLNEASLTIYQFANGAWTVVPGSSVNTTTHIVYAQISTTGLFAIVGTEN